MPTREISTPGSKYQSAKRIFFPDRDEYSGNGHNSSYVIHFITSKKPKWNHLWKVQEDYGARFREIAVYKSPSLTNRMFAGIIKVFPNVFVSGIVGEVEHL